ncbi:MAG: M23 family metallopeptidase [Oscillospiraceae bacterium]|nr:M23 family metallopeptidase [Oscillospiraceae bacterium]
MKSKSGKKRIIVLIAALLCIPAVIVAAILIIYTSSSLSPKQISEVILNIQDEKHTYDSEEDISFYSGIISSGVKIKAPARDSDEYSRIGVEFNKISGISSYTLLLSSSPDDCLYVDSHGEYYRINKNYALKLLLLPETAFVYEYSSMPIFTVTAGETSSRVYPEDATWSYKTAGGEYRTCDYKGENPSGVMSISDDIRLKFEFSSKPDWLNVKIYNEKGELVFNGDEAELDSFNYGYDGNLTAEIEAEWYREKADNNVTGDTAVDSVGSKKTGESDCYGRMKFKVALQYDEPASLILSALTVNPGEIIIIKVMNATGETFDINTDALSRKPVMISYGSNGLVLLAIPAETSAGEKTIEFIGAKSSLRASFTVNSKEFDENTVTPSKCGCTSDEYLSAYGSLQAKLEALNNAPVGEKLWNGEFILPVFGNDTWIRTRFGSVIKVSGTDNEIRQSGVDYVNEEGSGVLAANDGKVVFAEDTIFGGKTLIIDHGLGVKSIYYHLASISVQDGDTVYKSQIIGKLGQSGFSDDIYLQYSVSINGVFINPYILYQNGNPLANLS